MAIPTKRRLNALETAIRKNSADDGLSADETAVLLRAKAGAFLPAWCERVKREAAERQRNGERPEYDPERAARCNRVLDRIRAALDRVIELENEGRLPSIVARLKTMGRWPDEDAGVK